MGVDVAGLPDSLASVDSAAKDEKDRFRTHSTELGLLLWALWNPIGAGVPLDEYDTYVPTIWRMLAEHAGPEVVAAELARISEEQIEVDRGTSLHAATRLTQWWYWRFEFPEESES